LLQDQDDTIDLTQILQSFELPETQLEFSFEELYKATSMRKKVSGLASVSACLQLLCRFRCMPLSLCVAFAVLSLLELSCVSLSL